MWAVKEGRLMDQDVTFFKVDTALLVQAFTPYWLGYNKGKDYERRV